MVRAHLVVTKDADGSISTHPLKGWLRANSEYLPSGMDAYESTSHELRRGLQRSGWKLQFNPNEVLIVRPDEAGDTSYADELIDERVADETTDQEVETACEVTFGLERDLQAAIRANIDQLETGMTILDGGKERTTQAGRIDITSRDRQGSVVVLELKAGRASAGVIAQVLSYMSAVADEEKKPVRGMIVAGDFSDRVILAAKAVPNLELVKYSFRFSFEKLA